MIKTLNNHRGKCKLAHCATITGCLSKTTSTLARKSKALLFLHAYCEV